MSTLHIRLLGGFDIHSDGERVELVCPPRRQSLLAYLLLRHSAQPRRQIAFALWPETSEEQAHTNLRRELYHLRRLLPDADRFLEIGSRTLGWRSDAPVELDVARFEECIAQARTVAQPAQSAEERQWLEQAVGCYTGDLLPDCYDDWIQPEREQLHQFFVQSLVRLIDLCEETRQYPAAIRYAELWRSHNRFDEAPYRRLMHLHLLDGDRAAALSAYHACAAMLEQELDVPPSAATQGIYHRLLQTTHEPSPAKSPPVRAQTSLLVGRQTEWQTLRKLWEAAQNGRPHFVCIAGEPGIGKSRLAEELLVHVQQQGFSAAQARAYAAEGRLAYDPISVWLRSDGLGRRLQAANDVWLMEVAHLLPDLLADHADWSAPQPLSESWQRRHFFEALARTFLSVSEPLLLVLDDLQWCDRETLEWIHYLLRFDPNSPLLVIGTLRIGEIDGEHPVTALLYGLHQSGQATEIALGPLTFEETAQLVQQLGGRPLDPGQTAAAQQVTEGNPLFVEEMVRAGMLGGLVSGTSMEHTALPPKLQAVIEARIARLSPPARTLAALAATVGRSFTLDILRHASDVGDDSLIVALDELWQRRIVREQGDNRYDFSHDKIREVVYAGVSPARRSLLHRQVAHALEQLYAADLDAVSGQIADHYARAGLPDQALPYYERAADVAQRVYAHAEASHYLTSALALLDHLPINEARLRQELRLQLALALSWINLKSNSAPQLHLAYQRAHAIAQQLSDEAQRLVAAHGIATSYLSQGQLHKAYALTEQCILLARASGDLAVLAETSVTFGVILEFLGQWQAGREHLETIVYQQDYRWQVSSSLLQHEHPRLIARRHLAIVLWHLGYPDQARTCIGEARVLAKEIADPFSLAAVLSWSAWLALFCRESQLAQAWAEEEIVFSEQQGFSHWLVMSQTITGWALAQQGHTAQGIALIQGALNSMRSVNGGLQLPGFLGLLADAYAQAKQPEQGLRLLDEALDLVETSGERFSQAELYRQKGILLQRVEGHESRAESCFVQALAVARQQGAKSLELRAALCLSRLWQRQQKRAEAYSLLSEIYGWFSEGLETRDLREAAALLAQLR